MTPRRKDSLLIATAFVAILGAGFGLGNLLGPHRAAAPESQPPIAPLESLEEETLAALRKALDLTPDQESRIRADIRRTSRAIHATRHRALFEYHRHMLDLHDQIAPGLTPRQQDILRKNRKKLQDTIENRFPDLLEHLESGPHEES